MNFVPKNRHFIWSTVFVLLVVLLQGGCGYHLSSTPYQLSLGGTSMVLAIPVAENHSRYGHLGPDLTRAMVDRLSGVPGLKIQSVNGAASLKMNIKSVVVGSGSWDVIGADSGEIPEASSSRTASITVEAIFTRPGPDNDTAPIVTRRVFGSSRTYMVSQNQGQVEMQEEEAIAWVIDDLSQKIAMNMFNEF